MTRDIIGPGNKEALSYDANGNPIGSLGGAINTHVADVHTELFNHFVVNKDGMAVSTLNGAVSQGDTAMLLVNSTGFTPGQQVDINDGTTHVHHYRKITDNTANILTLDAPVDQDFPNGSLVEEATFDMSVIGSLASPVIYTLQPKSTEVLHVVRALIGIVHTAAADDSKFGSISALTNGVVIREVFGNGTIRTLTIWQLNKDMKEDMYDVTYTDKAGAGLYGTNGRWSFDKAGVISRLDGAAGDHIQVLIQDSLNIISDFQIKFQGHIEGS